MTERTRWGLLVLSLIIAFGGGLGLAYVLIERNERQRDRDLCDLIAVFVAPTPPPTTDRGRQQYDALLVYRSKRC